MLRDAVHACGALYAGTERAAAFFHRTAYAVRATVTAEFVSRLPPVVLCCVLMRVQAAHHTAYVDDYTAAYKLLAAGMMQTTMMFHPDAEERAKVHAFHGTSVSVRLAVSCVAVLTGV